MLFDVTLKPYSPQHEEDYEEQFFLTCQVRLKEIAQGTPKVTSPSQASTQSSPSIQPAPIEAGPQINTIASSSPTLKTLQSMNTSISSMASEIHQIYLAELDKSGDLRVTNDLPSP